MSSSGVKVKQERDESGDVDAARGRFDAALQGLWQKNESDSEHDSDPENRAKVFTKVGTSATNRGSRPPRKRRRKEIDLRDSGFHHTFVMRMFDRSVDLAQFDETTPLYPICRAWMINQPHNSNLNVKQEPGSPTGEATTTETGLRGDFLSGDMLPENSSNGTHICKLPMPEPWQEDEVNKDPRIPEPLPHPPNRLQEINESENALPGLLMTEHLKRWRKIRNLWRNASRDNDLRYASSYCILKAMFERAHEG